MRTLKFQKQTAFNKGECTSCDNNKCALMGYNSNNLNHFNGGSMFLNTNPNSPFCGYHHLFEIKVSSQSRLATGDIKLKINSDDSNILKPFVYTFTKNRKTYLIL